VTGKNSLSGFSIQATASVCAASATLVVAS
jgi:hypothetical protein